LITRLTPKRVIYNYAPVAGEIDLDSDTVIEIAETAPNIHAVFLSYVVYSLIFTMFALTNRNRCGNVGKLARIATVTANPSFRTSYPRTTQHASFQTLAGFTNILLPSVSVGAEGAISPLSNIAPVRNPKNLEFYYTLFCGHSQFSPCGIIQKFTMKLWKAAQSLDSSASLQEARNLQGLTSLAEAELLKAGVVFNST